MVVCDYCIHFNVCKFKDEKVNIGSAVKDLLHNCTDYIGYENLICEGEWVGEYDKFTINGVQTYVECSNCHKLRIVDNYCSNCGSKNIRK